MRNVDDRGEQSIFDMTGTIIPNDSVMPGTEPNKEVPVEEDPLAPENLIA